MATIALHGTDAYLESFERFERARGAGGPANGAWFLPIRRAAIARFAELGFPTLKDEDWRFTDLSPLVETPFQMAEEGAGAGAGAGRVGAADLAPFTFAGLRCHLLVFVNGRHVPELSSVSALPKGVVVASLADAMCTRRELVEPHLARYADVEQSAFSALNTAFLEDGGFVHIPKGVVLDEPIHLLYVTTATPAPVVAHPRNLVVAEEQTQAAVVEHYVSVADGVYFSNAVSEVVAGDGSVLSHTLIERESRQAFNISTLRVQQGRSSTVTSHTVLLGGALVRNNVHPVLAGEGCDCLINGLFMGTGAQHMDNYMRVEHVGPHSTSRQFYNGILDGASHGVFHGRIVVHPGAQKTDAKQTNRNLLLAREAQIDTKPQLEIYADDVKCTHGATIGQVHEDAIFYLRSRGLSQESARALLLYAFASECLERMKVEGIRKHLEGLVIRWLSGGELLAEGRAGVQGVAQVLEPALETREVQL